MYFPLGSVPPMTLEVVSSGVVPSATRTMTVAGLVCAPMASSVRASVPLVPAFPAAAPMLVARTGVLSGKVAGSASSAVATKPTTAVATVRMGRVPSSTSNTRTPW
ncbi:hypothetical protein D3C86_1854530 [compost metagenome]